MDASDIPWPESVWGAINDCVLSEVGKVRIGQKMFQASIDDSDPNQIPNEVIDFKSMTILEGDTKTLVEISREFSLTDNQVAHEEDQNTCQTLATMAAKELALAEDAYLFQLSDRTAKRPESIPILDNPRLHVDNWRTAVDFGLLGEANAGKDASDSDPEKVAEPINVELSGQPGSTYGENTFTAVTSGIAKLVSKAQAQPYALLLPTAVYADTFVPPTPASLVTTADRIKPLVEGGFYSSGVLPPDEGLLVALAGDPVRICIGKEAAAEYVRKSGRLSIFRVVERVQYVVRDPRSLILLKFAATESD